jgi:hypothetical protein
MESNQTLNTNRLKPEENDFLEKLRHSLDLRLDDEGRFFYEGDLVAHPKVNALFHQSIHIHPETKEAYLKIAQQIAYFRVDSFPFFVTQFELTSQNEIKITLNTQEVLINAINRIDSVGLEKIYITLKDQRKCGVLRKARDQMLVFLEETTHTGQESQFVLCIANQIFKITEVSSLDELKIKD